MIKNNLVWFGTIINTHGIKGEVKLLSNSDSIEKRLKPGNKIYLNENDFLEVENYRFNKKIILVKFKNINSINEAEKFKSKRIYFIRNINEEINENIDFYYYEIIGFVALDKNNKIIGEIIEYFDQVYYYSFLIKTNDNKKVNIPIINETISKVDKENKKIYFKINKEDYLQ